MQNLILNNTQAKAVYSAMCALNNVCARVHVRIEHDYGLTLHVVEYEDGSLVVKIGDMVGNPSGLGYESYANQDAFVSAYGCADPVAFKSKF